MDGGRKEVHGLPEPGGYHVLQLHPDMSVDQVQALGTPYDPLLHQTLPLEVAEQILALDRRRSEVWEVQ